MCIASDIAPHRELMDTLQGLSFPVGDIQAISTCLDVVERMAESRIEDFKQAAIAMVSRRFNWKMACSEHDRLYKKAVETENV